MNMNIVNHWYYHIKTYFCICRLRRFFFHNHYEILGLILCICIYCEPNFGVIPVVLYTLLSLALLSVHIVIPGSAECGVGGEERTEDQPRLSVSVLQQPQPDLQCSNRQQTWLATSWSWGECVTPHTAPLCTSHFIQQRLSQWQHEQDENDWRLGLHQVCQNHRQV